MAQTGPRLGLWGQPGHLEWMSCENAPEQLGVVLRTQSRRNFETHKKRKFMALYSRDNARRSLIDTVAYRAMSQLATVLGYVVMVRGMTEEDFGVFNLLYAFIPVVSTFASLGLEQHFGVFNRNIYGPATQRQPPGSPGS
jgi:hypothetical protein